MITIKQATLHFSVSFIVEDEKTGKLYHFAAPASVLNEIDELLEDWDKNIIPRKQKIEKTNIQELQERVKALEGKTNG